MTEMTITQKIHTILNESLWAEQRIRGEGRNSSVSYVVLGKDAAAVKIANLFLVAAAGRKALSPEPATTGGG